MYRYTLAVAFAVVSVLRVTPAQGATITYTETATGTGTLNGTPFTNNLITITLVGDTSNLLGAGCCLFVPGSATVNVSGVATDTFTDAIEAFRTNSGTFIAAGIEDRTLGTLLLLASENAAFASYNLVSPIGPLSGTADFNGGMVFATALGSFDVVSIAGDSSTFTTSVPEPSAGVLLITGLVAALLRYRRRLSL